MCPAADSVATWSLASLPVVPGGSKGEGNDQGEGSSDCEVGGDGFERRKADQIGGANCDCDDDGVAAIPISAFGQIGQGR